MERGQKRASQVLRRRGTVTVSGMASTLTSAWWLQASHVAVTAAHVLKRHRRAGFATHGRAARLVEDEVQGIRKAPCMARTATPVERSHRSDGIFMTAEC